MDFSERQLFREKKCVEGVFQMERKLTSRRLVLVEIWLPHTILD
jgi:hypothetical protein